MNNEDTYITILDEDDNEVLAEVLFTFAHESENYVLMTLVSEFEDVDDFEAEYQVLAYKYEEMDDGTIGNLIEIPQSDTETWQVVEEMFETFSDSEFDFEESK